MSPKEPEADAPDAADPKPLAEILSSELGEPEPVEKYHRPLGDDEQAAFQKELDAVEDAHAAAAAKLHTLFAG